MIVVGFRSIARVIHHDHEKLGALAVHQLKLTAAGRQGAVPMPADRKPPGGGLFVLVAGWPGSGKSTLAAALAPELGLPLLAKDEIKEALMDALGAPATVADSQ